jgi:hypothetical protein
LCGAARYKGMKNALLPCLALAEDHYKIFIISR